MGFVRFDTEGAVGIVTIDRPKALSLMLALPVLTLIQSELSF